MLKKRCAFTLVELMVVVAIIVILARVALVKYYGALEKARSAEAYSVLADIASAETGYFTEYDAYTTTWSNLDRYDSAPSSSNFNFATALNNVASGYVQAIATAGSVNYYMCVSGGKKSAGSAPTCP
ncbi:MAG: prepilin-type N-terminal cleavage/methylation domain-containing protein [Candidatus Omnitrophica bacterium]|nr:prepilin-type N-terminal cleavage/methylation domain-containing protein [Candidatus Omnitrophota bacterium]MDD5027686.1 prepilin-type N-terminal cleavage/methylation domain-containing protein [Candidatus Omnitrophota bacterium]MDD5662075.1 prepilin-type N-terminal cleavage/methylation domain-containing protein [Candidatus Omnitrophota bacterium]